MNYLDIPIKKKNKQQRRIIELYKIENFQEINRKIVREIKQEEKMEEIIQIIEKNPWLLEKLDIKKLEIIDNYYKDKIAKYKNKLTN